MKWITAVEIAGDWDFHAPTWDTEAEALIYAKARIKAHTEGKHRYDMRVHVMGLATGIPWHVVRSQDKAYRHRHAPQYTIVVAEYEHDE